MRVAVDTSLLSSYLSHEIGLVSRLVETSATQVNEFLPIGNIEVQLGVEPRKVLPQWGLACLIHDDAGPQPSKLAK